MPSASTKQAKKKLSQQLQQQQISSPSQQQPPSMAQIPPEKQYSSTVSAAPAGASVQVPATLVRRPFTLLLIVGVALAAAITAAAIYVAITAASSPKSHSSELRSNSSSQEPQPPPPRQTLHQSEVTLWVLPNNSVVITPPLHSQFYDAALRRFVPPSIPAHLPVAKEIGQVRRWRYEWRWEWEKGDIDACAGANVGTLVSTSTKSPELFLLYREDLERNGAGETPSCPSLGANDTDGIHSASAHLAAWKGNHSAFAFLPSLSGTYTAFLRLYKMHHAGGVGAISLPTAADTQSTSQKSPITLLQSIRLSSQAVEIASPPRPKTRVGAYYPKKLGERLELIVSASGYPAPDYAWFKNGFLLQRNKDDKPHMLVLDKLANVRAETWAI